MFIYGVFQYEDNFTSAGDMESMWLTEEEANLRVSQAEAFWCTVRDLFTEEAFDDLIWGTPVYKVIPCEVGVANIAFNAPYIDPFVDREKAAPENNLGKQSDDKLTGFVSRYQKATTDEGRQKIKEEIRTLVEAHTEKRKLPKVPEND